MRIFFCFHSSSGGGTSYNLFGKVLLATSVSFGLQAVATVSELVSKGIYCHLVYVVCTRLYHKDHHFTHIRPTHFHSLTHGIYSILVFYCTWLFFNRSLLIYFTITTLLTTIITHHSHIIITHTFITHTSRITHTFITHTSSLTLQHSRHVFTIIVTPYLLRWWK